MRAGFAYMLLAASLLAAGCEAPGGTASDADAAETAAVSPTPVPHESARFLVRGSEDVYRVNVRYVDMIEESVIAVRQGAGDPGEDRPAVDLAEPPRAPSSLPFGEDAWRSFALAIADRIRQRQGICPEGRPMELLRENGEVRAMYRENREAWVVFAACPGAGEG